MLDNKLHILHWFLFTITLTIIVVIIAIGNAGGNAGGSAGGGAGGSGCHSARFLYPHLIEVARRPRVAAATAAAGGAGSGRFGAAGSGAGGSGDGCTRKGVFHRVHCHPQTHALFYRCLELTISMGRDTHCS